MTCRNKAALSLVLFLAAWPLHGCGGTDTADPERWDEAVSRVGTTYKVGPTRTYKALGAVASMLAAGDIVELDGGATYSGGVVLSKSGTAASKITIRGMRVNGKRPVISGGTNTIEVQGSHYLFEALDITNGSFRCFYHHGDDITIRDSVVRNCPGHGIHGADNDSGSLTLDYVEVHSSGSGTTRHPIYMATDESAHPGSVFRMQHCYIHDGLGGNNVKTRAERNEIYYNWIEGGLYKELELIGPDGATANKREDSDVVGNVFLKTKTQFVVRVGGDGTGDTNGRYRFVNNTFLLKQGSAAAIHLFDGIESIEIHNNVFYRIGGGSVQIFQDDASWSTGAALVAGTNNVVPSGTSVPGQWKNTLVKSDPGFVDVASKNVQILSSSPLRDAGAANPAGVPNHAFPSPLLVAAYHPPPGHIEAVGTAEPRPVVGAIDIGAFEYGSGGVLPPPPPPPLGGCVTATAGTWQSTAFTSQTGSFTASLDVTPSATGLDGAIGLSYGAQSKWSGLASIVRFGPTNVIDVRNGGTYGAAVSMPYTAGATYHLRIVVNVATDSYSVYVTPPGGSEKLLAQNYGFRTEQVGVPSLDTWVVNQEALSGSLAGCNFNVQ